MRFRVVGAALRRLADRSPLARPGGTDPDDARRLADAERALGSSPDGCAWLDERTAGDLDLPLVFAAIDRTITPTGAQALWRWLAAPALRLDVITDRERRLALLAREPALRATARAALRATAVAPDAPHLPRLLWEPPPAPLGSARFAALAGALGCAIALALWLPVLWVAVVVLFCANVVIDDWANVRLAHQARALEVLGGVLAAAARAVDRLPRALTGDLANELAAMAPLRKRLAVLAVRDPLDVVPMLRAGFLVRLLVLGSCLALLERERARLRRIVLWAGEVDALVSIASLRAERTDCRVPVLSAEPRAWLAARDLVHPAIAGAIGNDVALDREGLLVTGSNMSGKSTFLRTIAVNAICAQSIHTTFGAWHASLYRVHAVMRPVDDMAAGLSKYAVEVTAIGRLVAAARTREDQPPALIALDEPFSGTNPTLRVPIVVAVLDHLAARDLAIAATHDLDVAAQVDPCYQRGYFCELDELAGSFDHRLRRGIAPSTNAIALLERAGYPASILAEVERRVAAH